MPRKYATRQRTRHCRRAPADGSNLTEGTVEPIIGRRSSPSRKILEKCLKFRPPLQNAAASSKIEFLFMPKKRTPDGPRGTSEAGLSLSAHGVLTRLPPPLAS